jgi:hypothetical protein
MPYYVYAIHTDSDFNRLYKSVDDFHEAEELEREMNEGRYPGDNYVVRMIHADNDQHVIQKIQEIRKERQWPLD